VNETLKSKLKSSPREDAQGKFQPIRRLYACSFASGARDTAVSIGVVLGLLYLPPILAQAVADPLRRHLLEIAPMSAGLAIQATTNLHTLPIAPWAGLGVLAAWAIASLLFGGLLLRLRDA